LIGTTTSLCAGAAAASHEHAAIGVHFRSDLAIWLQPSGVTPPRKFGIVPHVSRRRNAEHRLKGSSPMLTPEQIPDAVIEAAIEEYEAATFARLDDKQSFAAMIAAAINRWPGGKIVDESGRADVVLMLD
jgi:hypothetical protein